MFRQLTAAAPKLPRRVHAWSLGLPNPEPSGEKTAQGIAKMVPKTYFLFQFLTLWAPRDVLKL